MINLFGCIRSSMKISVDGTEEEDLNGWHVQQTAALPLQAGGIGIQPLNPPQRGFS